MRVPIERHALRVQKCGGGSLLMLRQLKTLARAVAPTLVKNAWGHFSSEMKRRRARIAFQGATTGPSFLPPDTLNGLMRRGYRPPDAIRYDPDALVLRAEEKVAQMQARLPLTQGRACVELGC